MLVKVLAISDFGKHNFSWDCEKLQEWFYTEYSYVLWQHASKWSLDFSV